MDKPLPLEQTDHWLAELFMDIANKNTINPITKKKYGTKYGISEIRTMRGGGMCAITTNNKMILIPLKVGRNDPCPDCKVDGKIIKWKKCKEHNN